MLDRKMNMWDKAETTRCVFRFEVGDLVFLNTAAVHRPMYQRRERGARKWGRLHYISGSLFLQSYILPKHGNLNIAGNLSLHPYSFPVTCQAFTAN